MDVVADLLVKPRAHVPKPWVDEPHREVQLVLLVAGVVDRDHMRVLDPRRADEIVGYDRFGLPT